MELCVEDGGECKKILRMTLYFLKKRFSLKNNMDFYEKVFYENSILWKNIEDYKGRITVKNVRPFSRYHFT